MNKRKRNFLTVLQKLLQLVFFHFSKVKQFTRCYRSQSSNLSRTRQVFWIPDGLAGLVDPEHERLLRVRREILRLAVPPHSGEDPGGRGLLPDEQHHQRLHDSQVGRHPQRRGLDEHGLRESAVRRLRHIHPLPRQGLRDDGCKLLPQFNSHNF